MWNLNRKNAQEGMTIQVTSIESDIKEIFFQMSTSSKYYFS